MALLASNPLLTRTTKQIVDAALEEGLRYLQRQGLRLLTRNYRTRGRFSGEIDLILRAPDATLVFMEVRSRADGRHVGAVAISSFAKRRRIVFAPRI
jgi:putative endonuclease